MPINLRSMQLKHGLLEFPVFLPDATFAVVRSVDSEDLESCQIQAVVMNTFHLMQNPGSTVVRALGGLHKMSGWKRPIITDSGGFQAYSLIRQNPKFGKLTERGLVFHPEGSDRDFQLTPEKSVQLQISYRSDVVICLDDCTHADAPEEEQRKSVERTIAWAKRSRREFDQLVERKRLGDVDRPKLFGVIQGGAMLDLRRYCAEALLEIGFDGFGFGGWPLDGEGNLLVDVLSFLREIVPFEFPIHALGIGHPVNLMVCYDLGYDIFDCAMPTRDARHGRLYAFRQPASAAHAGLSAKQSRDGSWLKFIYINDEMHTRSDQPVSENCDCLVCKRYSLGYLRHLFKQNDGLFLRLATIHNLRFMTQLTERLQIRG